MQTLSIISIAIIFILISESIATEEQLNRFTKYFIFSGIIFCTIGVLFFSLSILGLMNYGGNIVDDLTTPYGAYGTMVEPNIFGGYCLGYFIFSFTLALTTKASNGLIIYLLSTSFLGLYMSFTRGAWIAACIGLFLALLYIKQTKVINVKRLGFLIVFAVILYALVGTLTSNYFLTYKIINIINTDSGTASLRLAVWGAALENIKNHLLFGTGTYSFATIMGDGSYDPHTNLWIGNLFITLLHDYGIVGFFLFSLFFISVVFTSIRLVRQKYNNIESEDKWMLLSLCLSVISIYIAFFFTTGFSLSYSWIFLGMIALYKRKLELYPKNQMITM
jgi:O-antigen ligase